MEIDKFPGTTPPVQKLYHANVESSRVLEEIIEEWQEAGLVEPSNSPYTAPALLVDKDGKKHPIFDYCHINAQTVPLLFLMPNIDDQLSELSEAELYIILDLFMEDCKTLLT